MSSVVALNLNGLTLFGNLRVDIVQIFLWSFSSVCSLFLCQSLIHSLASPFPDFQLVFCFLCLKWFIYILTFFIPIIEVIVNVHTVIQILAQRAHDYCWSYEWEQSKTIIVSFSFIYLMLNFFLLSLSVTREKIQEHSTDQVFPHFS